MASKRPRPALVPVTMARVPASCVALSLSFLQYVEMRLAARVSRAFAAATQLRGAMPRGGTRGYSIPFMINETVVDDSREDVDRSVHKRIKLGYWSALPRMDEAKFEDRWLLPGRPTRKYRDVLLLYEANVAFCLVFRSMVGVEPVYRIGLWIEGRQVIGVDDNGSYRIFRQPFPDFTIDAVACFRLLHLFDTGLTPTPRPTQWAAKDPRGAPANMRLLSELVDAVPLPAGFTLYYEGRAYEPKLWGRLHKLIRPSTAHGMQWVERVYIEADGVHRLECGNGRGMTWRTTVPMGELSVRLSNRARGLVCPYRSTVRYAPALTWVAPIEPEPARDPLMPTSVVAIWD